MLQIVSWRPIVALCLSRFYQFKDMTEQVHKWIMHYDRFADTFCINTLRPMQNDRHFPDDIFKRRISVNENV